MVRTLIQIPSGSYLIGTNEKVGFGEDHEGPRLLVEMSSFEIDACTVTNAEFAKFVSETNYQTEAERFGWSFVFHYFLSDATKAISQHVPNMTWWYAVPHADWLHPEGPDSTINTRMNHPVVQVSRNDALAYCKWAGKRLPTEAEWEIAAKGGSNYERFPWGEELLENERYQCNIWQGAFPTENNYADGFGNTAPAKYYAPNGYGLYQVIGNVWEWCSNLARIPLSEFQRQSSQFFSSMCQDVDDAVYATRGGSFLCHQSYCKRYRIVARNGNSGMSAANNLGFRCVR